MQVDECSVRGAGGDAVRALRLLAPEPCGAGVVLAHEVFGLDAFTRGVGERLAAAGYDVVAPDLYAREGLPGPASTVDDPAPEWPVETIRAAAQALPDRRAVLDLDGAAAALVEGERVAADRVAVLGFCRGGTLALLAGCQGRRFSAVACCYGRLVYPELSAEQPVQPLEMILGLEAPLLGLFGDQDASIPSKDVEALRTRMEAFARYAEVEIYEGAGHGFLNPLRAGHHPAHADAAWDRLLSFLGETLV